MEVFTINARRITRNPTFRIISALVIGAIAVTLIIYLVIYLAGYRIVKYRMGDEEIRFYGKVDDYGVPYDGTIYYPDGIRGTLDGKTSTVTYSNGDVYVGEIRDLQRHGKGRITFAGGESYEGDFSDNEITGTGTYKYASAENWKGEAESCRPMQLYPSFRRMPVVFLPILQ